MGLNDLVEHLQKVDLMEAEAFDRGQGLEPLLNEFVYEMEQLPDEDKIKRIREISEYYKVIYERTHGNVRMAYEATRKFAYKIYVQHYAKKMDKDMFEALDKKKLGHCYDLSGRFVMDNPEWSLVHGSITRKDGYTIPHAWAEKIEQNGNYEMRMVHDPVLGMGDLPWDAYERLLGAKANSKYSNDQMSLKCVKNKHWGPWESVDEKEKFFKERTSNHIGMVQAAAKKLSQARILSEEDSEKLMNQVAHHDQSKFEEPEHTPYVSLTWRHKIEKEQGEFDSMKDKGYQTPGLLAKEDENDATLHHVRNNSHHPEAHLADKGEANIDPNDRNKSVKCIDASAMPDVDVAEMVADWQAMSQELGTNSARQWFKKCQDVRWHFSEHQVELIDKLLKVFEMGVGSDVDESLKESAIDFPKDELPREIWTKKDGKYSLKPEIKDQILAYVKSYPGQSLLDISQTVHVCGSLATNLYTQYSDLDVHVVIDTKKFNDKEKQEELVKEVGDWSEEHPKDIEGHPCQVYTQMNPAQDYVGDSAWNLMEEFWVKGPKITRLNFNPYTYYREILGEVEKKSKECDIKIGALSRHVIDYASIKDAYKKIPKSGKAPLRALMKKKLGKIEDDIEALSKFKKEWVKKRRSVSQPKTIQQAVTDKRMQEEWEKANAVFKYLAKYDYLLTIKALENILEDDDVLDDKDVNNIKQILNIENDFEKVSPDQKEGEKK